MMTQERFFQLVYAWKDGDLTGDELYQRVFILSNVSQQRELLLAYEEHTSYKVLGKKTDRISKQMVEDFLANNCG